MPKQAPLKRTPAPDTEIREMVLLTLIRAEENRQALSPFNLAQELALARSVIEVNLQTLQEQSLVMSESSGAVRLTTAGRIKASSLLRRHRLTERLFNDVLGLDWARTHQEADKFEHAMSPEAEQQLASRLGHPETCPHGNPIPQSEQANTFSSTSSRPLAGCAPHTHARISRIALEIPASLQHLATLGLLPNVEIDVENKAPLGGPVLVRVGRAHYALGRDLASRIWVEVIEAQNY